MKSPYYQQKVTAKGDLSSILQHLFVRSRVKAMSMMGGEQESGVVGSGRGAVRSVLTALTAEKFQPGENIFPVNTVLR